jgi:hypothetical protein
VTSKPWCRFFSARDDPADRVCGVEEVHERSSPDHPQIGMTAAHRAKTRQRRESHSRAPDLGFCFPELRSGCHDCEDCRLLIAQNGLRRRGCSSCGSHRQCANIRLAALATGHCHPNSDEREKEHATRADEGELRRIPNEREHEEVEPPRSTVSKEVGADLHKKQVGNGQEHRRDTPLEIAPGSDRGEQAIGRCVAEGDVGANAGWPDEPEHGHRPLNGSATRT